MKIHTILTHLRPHLDEIMAIFMLRRWGEEKFPGVSTAQIKFLTTGKLPENMSAKAIMEKGILPLGVGGDILDEHPSDGQDRKQGQSASSLTAEVLGLSGDEALMKIVREVTHCDLTNNVEPTQLSSLIKIMHRRLSDNAEYVITWATIAIEALYKNGACQIPRQTDSGYVKAAGRRIIERKRSCDSKAAAHLRNSLAQSEGLSDRTLTELAHLWKSIKATSGEYVARMWLTIVIEEMLRDNYDYQNAINIVNGSQFLEFNAVRQKLTLCVVTSDNEHINNAARSVNCGCVHLILQRCSKGKTYIFLNSRNPQVMELDLKLDDMIRMIRWRETKRHGEPYRGAWDDLVTDGVMPCAPEWYYPRGNGIILNGSVTTPHVKSSRLAIPELINIALHAFNPDLVDEWREKQGANNEWMENADLADDSEDGIVTAQGSEIMMPEDTLADLETLMVTSFGS